jgi:hypothetical protein
MGERYTCARTFVCEFSSWLSTFLRARKPKNLILAKTHFHCVEIVKW